MENRNLSRISLDLSHADPIYLKRGYNENVKPQRIYPNKNGVIHIDIKELERVEIHFYNPTLNISPLPIGSTLDTKRGVFYWCPGPGFLGEYQLFFMSREKNGKLTGRGVNIKIIPLFKKPQPGAKKSPP